MRLTPLQLQIQERADKTLSFGCIIYDGEGYCFFAGDRRDVMQSYMFDGLFIKGISTSYKSIGHPMNLGRLLYLFTSNKEEDASIEIKEMMEFFAENKECLQQTVLERPTELNKRVLKFLLSLHSSPHDGANTVG